jgi:hypothetical protein
MAQKQSQNDVDLSGQTVWVIDLFSRVYQLFHALPEMSSPEGHTGLGHIRSHA